MGTKTRTRPGVRLNFAIDQDHLAFAATFALFDISAAIKELREFALALSPRNYLAVQEEWLGLRWNKWYLVPELKLPTPRLSEELSSYMEQIKRSPQFHKVVEETEKFLGSCKAEWERNYARSSKIMRKITGLELDKDITVVIFPPGIPEGKALFPKNVILFGLRAEFENFNTVVLWHEILHGSIDSSSGSAWGCTPVSHAIIELAADQELAKALNGISHIPDIDFPGVIIIWEEARKAMSRDWEKYMGQENRDILEFERRMLKKYPKFEAMEKARLRRLIR